ncbi:MAG: hypothetical protein A3I44_04945 [Candidatus Sungbacteria bacterium RIFCSPLOWO2_02_FULL_51_17]|uniref:Uncharacterized protein n=1 Tax=Candidatus Sungbacteria bacterium RIFCSPHIGHO2_02_FULL_51_29 TaxID=1802273 RepID=A0A1G2KY57_9BACT|nr:MAG: hypothetical protein A2676_03800 [Candidatus Sungbacteria bacterium RIFCSPHIGHO2_01_FULL_51_22]OHA03389.1 MAG: hypothetical protein A3C16_05685 [Candidatus Sungbacteria bacterium RIFCSPHIGHO2_02_FULL_51_29]OHA05259.1 MAG: hypothetical protein A3B29_00170 [Candidatus Sungbacteria bacterium RIFCSPLOWO2_01_FULL_51_34]OHA11687.1 MAG: hypothetical protein A3I44_04945 [Candidatus Sungbacteria bacterium RIFCSPLOWO2_02_FULL_51_17]
MNKQTIGVIIVLLFLGVFVFYWFSRTPSVPAGSSVSVPEEGQLVEFEKINNISLDAEFFRDPFFTALKEFPTATGTVHYTPGRANPFIPF